MQQRDGKLVLNRDALLERLEGDAELVDEVLGIYWESSAEMLDDLRAAVAEQDATRVERSAHSLKGALQNISAEASAEHALLLEEAGRAGRLGLCAQILADLEEELALLHAALGG